MAFHPCCRCRRAAGPQPTAPQPAATRPARLPAAPTPPQTVVGALLRHGVQTFPDLLRTSGLPPPLLKSALLVLLQHNCANAYFQQEPPTLRGPGPSYQLYEAATDRILQILRWAGGRAGGRAGGGRRAVRPAGARGRAGVAVYGGPRWVWMYVSWVCAAVSDKEWRTQGAAVCLRPRRELCSSQ